jgi:YidC/Oxa1 family membrane protein insertase
MGFSIAIFNLILYQPLFNALILLYEYFPGQDFGIAVIVLTLLIKIILYPVGAMAIKAQKKLSQLQPKIEEIQLKYKQDKEKLVKEVLELYKRERVNPFSGFLPLLIQLPILIALFRVFWRGFEKEQLTYLYSFVPTPGVIDTTFLGILDLSSPNIIVAFLAGVAQFYQGKMLTPKTDLATPQKTRDFSKMMQGQMLYFLPLFTVFILWKLPSVVGIYWLVMSVFTILQQNLILAQKINV